MALRALPAGGRRRRRVRPKLDIGRGVVPAPPCVVRAGLVVELALHIDVVVVAVVEPAVVALGAVVRGDDARDGRYLTEIGAASI